MIRTSNLFRSGWKEPEQIGTLFSTNFANLTGWLETTPNATFTPGGSGLAISGGAGSSWVADYADYDYPNGLENFQMSFALVMTVAGSLSFTINSIQRIDTGGGNGLNRSFYGNLVCSGGNYFARIITFAENKYSVPYTGNISAGSAVSNGDSFTGTFTRSDFNLYTLVINNVTKGTSQTATYRQAYATIRVPNVCGRFGINAIDGQQLITSLTVTSTCYKNARALFVGDSITQGLQGSTGVDQGNHRYAVETFTGSSKRYEVNAGGNHTTTQILDCITHLKFMNPQYFFMLLGYNDIILGVAEATYKANYTSIRDQMRANGSQIVHCYLTPKDATDMTAFNSWLSSEFGGRDKIIDTFTPLADGTALDVTYDLGDGVHPNSTGQDEIANTINAAFGGSILI